MNLKELAAAAQKAASITKGRGSAVLQITVIDSQDIEFAAGGDRDAIVQGLAQVIQQDDSAKELISDAMEFAEYLDRKEKKSCNCPACQLREAMEEVFGQRAKRKSDPSVN